jgi:hypothetical protein
MDTISTPWLVNPAGHPLYRRPDALLIWIAPR